MKIYITLPGIHRAGKFIVFPKMELINLKAVKYSTSKLREECQKHSSFNELEYGSTMKNCSLLSRSILNSWSLPSLHETESMQHICLFRLRFNSCFAVPSEFS